MKTLFAVPLLLFSAIFAQAQTSLTQTSLSTAISDTIQTFGLASYTNVTGGSAPTILVVEREVMLVLSVTATNVSVARGQNGSRAVPHISGEMVLVGIPSYFPARAPTGSCTASATLATPVVDISQTNGAPNAQWLCSSILNKWVPGFNNDLAAPNVTAAVASAAGPITPSGPLFHVTGTAAITGFNIPIGFSSGTFTVIPDGVFTTTNAGNIAIASTAVVGKALTFTYDPNTGKFYPGY
jgi:hypothetical protein